jgi:hypothetical protein
MEGFLVIWYGSGSWWFDGKIQLWTSKWLVLLDHIGIPMVGRMLQFKEQIQSGSSFQIQNYLIKVLVVIPAIEVCESHPISTTPKSTSSPSRPRLQSWKITYSTHKDLHRGRMKAYDGTLEIHTSDNFMILNNAKGKQIGYHFCHKKDCFSVGSKITFPLYVVRMGVQMQATNSDLKRTDSIGLSGVSSSEVEPPCNYLLTSESDVDSVIVTNENALPMNTHVCQRSDVGTLLAVSSRDEIILIVHNSISLGLDFSHGRNFARDVRSKFSSTVHPSANSGHFMLVVSFGRLSFRLDEESASLALEAALGGYCGEFKVSILSDRVFCFCVADKEVGFHVIKLGIFLVLNLNVTFIFGGVVAQISKENFIVGCRSQNWNGLWLVHPKQELDQVWSCSRNLPLNPLFRLFTL